MAGSIYGRLFQISTWGESHGKGIGVVIDGCPAGLSLSEEDIQVYLDRRKPGQSQFTTGRKESDMAQIWSGVFEGRTTGTPISILVQNQDQRSRDYGNIMNTYRRDTQIIHLMKSMVSVITEEGDALPEEKLLPELQQVQLLLRF